MASEYRCSARSVMVMLAAAWITAGMTAGIAGCAEPSMSSEQWQKQVIEADTPVLVDFYAEQCPGCHTLTPALEALAADYEGRVALYKINCGVSRSLVERNDISRLPAVLMFVNGQEVRRWAGELDIEPYRQAVEAALAGKPIK